MFRILFITVLFVLAATNVSAQRNGYVRKKMQPTFFVPEKELAPKREILPIDFRAAIPAPDLNHGTANYAIDKKFSYTAYNASGADYKRVYSEHVQDMKYIQKYKKMPQNNLKDADLAKMRTGERFRVK